MQESSRRRFLQLTAGGIAVAGLGGVAAARATASPAQVDELDENYKGHRIQIKRTARGSHAGHDQIGSTIYIDGVELHVMRLDGGDYVSSMAHYEPLSTLPQAARAAVDNLGPQKLRPFRA